MSTFRELLRSNDAVAVAVHDEFRRSGDRDAFQASMTKPAAIAKARTTEATAARERVARRAAAAEAQRQRRRRPRQQR